MEPFRYHVYVCDQQKPEGVPCCSARGSAKTIDALRRELAGKGLADEVQVTVCGSLGLCERGPNMVVYPEGVWYSGVLPEDVPELVESHFRNGRAVGRLVSGEGPAVGAEIRGNRDRMLAALRAKEAAGALPDDLEKTIRGYQESRVVLTALELDVFTASRDGATAAEVAAAIGADARATEMLLNALVAMALLSKQAGRFTPTPVSARFFVAGSKDDARAAVLHQSGLYARWSRLTECVRAGTATRREETSARGEEWTRYFIAAMHRNASERSPLVVAAVGTDGVRRMLDVGGGSGAYSIAFARSSQELRVDVFDLPAVLPITREHIQQAGLEGRIATRAGDLRTDRFGNGYDLVFVSAICHMLDESENKDFLARCHEALAPGGRLVIQDFILEADRTAPKHATLFSLNMLTGTRRGSSYAEEDYVSWMGAVGFRDTRRVRLPGPTGLMVGTRSV